MVVVYAVIILSVFFLLLFIGRIVEACLFVIKKEESLPKTEIKEQNNKKAIVKKSYIVIPTKKKLKLRSKVFYAYFLNEKAALKMPLSERFLVDEIYLKLSVNTKYLNCYIDYDRLRSSGIFNEKPIFKVEVKDKKLLEKMLEALIEVYKYIDFRAVFTLDEKAENKGVIDLINEKSTEIDCKIIFLKDINIKLLYEINKLNLNFIPEKTFNKKGLKADFVFNSIELNRLRKKLNMEEFSHGEKEFKFKMVKFLNLYNLGLDNSKICYYINFLNNKKTNKVVRFNVNYRLKSEFFNIEKKKDKIIVKYVNPSQKNDTFCFSKLPKNYEIIKVDGRIFIKFHFYLNIQQKSSFNFFLLSVQGQNIEINKSELVKFVYNNGISVQKCFNFKLYIKSNEFNEFFNNKLKELILEEKLSQNKWSEKFVLPNKVVQVICENLNYERKSLFQISSYSELYSMIIKEFFGLTFKESLIYIDSQKSLYKQNFKLVFLGEFGKYKSIYVSKESDFKGLDIGGVVYTNLKVVDLNLIENSAKFCV